MEMNGDDSLNKLLKFLNALPLETIEDIHKLDKTLSSLGIDNDEKRRMFQSLRDYVEKMNTQLDLPELHVWDNYEDAFEHFFAHVYKDILKTFPPELKKSLYRSSHEFKTKKHISDSKMHQILDLAGYTIVYTTGGLRISYPKSPSKPEED